MGSTQIDRITGLSSSAAIKVPVRVASAGVDFSAYLTSGGLPTMDGIQLDALDRVLLKDQDDQTQNGIYIAATSPWIRAQDFQNNSDLCQGTLVYAAEGTADGGQLFQLTTANPITIGTSDITFAVTSNPTVSSAMASVVSASTLAAARTAMGLGAAAVEALGGDIVDDGSGNLTIYAKTGLILTKVATPYTLQASDGGKYFQANVPEVFSLTLAAGLPLGSSIMIGAVADYMAALVIPSGIYVFGESAAWTDTTLNMPATAGGEYIILSYVTSNIFIVESMTPATAIALGVQGALSLLNVGAGLVSSSGNLNLNRYTSAQNAIPVAGSTLTVAHGLGAKPFGVSISLHCVTANQGWSAGDEIELGANGLSAASSSDGLMVYTDATNVYVIQGSGGNLEYFDKSTGAAEILTQADWTIVVKAAA